MLENMCYNRVERRAHVNITTELFETTRGGQDEGEYFSGNRFWP